VCGSSRYRLDHAEMRHLKARSSNDDMLVNFHCLITAEALTSHHRPVGSFCRVNLTASKGPDIPLKGDSAWRPGNRSNVRSQGAPPGTAPV
jgi:hypothetical protein